MVMIRAFVILVFVLMLGGGLLSFNERPSHAQAPADGEPSATAPVPAQSSPTAPAQPAAAETPETPATAAPVEKSPVVEIPPVTPPVAVTPPVPQPPVIATPPLPPDKLDDKAATKGPAARELFAAKKLPSLGEAAAIGYYPRGCLQGGVELPVDGPHWQVMRLSRNRNWGHPSLVRYVKNFATRAAKATGWNGILVGDLAQPRGGPTPTGHMSHQTGLDVDVWFVPMPKESLTREQRDAMSANNLVADDWKSINQTVYTPQHAAFIKAATESPEVERVLVNAAIKKKLCETATGDRSWLEKVRPWYGHHDHIHVRLRCPPGQPGCRAQPPTPASQGCGDADFKFWFTKALEPKKPSLKPAKPLTLADLPPACKTVLAAPAR